MGCDFGSWLHNERLGCWAAVFLHLLLHKHVPLCVRICEPPYRECVYKWKYNSMRPGIHRFLKNLGTGKGKVHHRTGHKSSEGE